MSEKHDFEELLEPAQAAERLNISVATLRKYSLIVEQVTGNDEYFVRTKQKTRLYSEKNLADLHDFKQLSKDASLTLKEAAHQIYAIQSVPTSEVSVPKDLDMENLDQEQIVAVLKMLQTTIALQNVSISGLQKQMVAVQKQNQELLEAQKALAAPKNVQTELELKPKAQSNARPKKKAADETVTEKVTVDSPIGADDIPDLEPEETKAPEKVAKKLDEIKENNPADPRAEILTKAVENSEVESQPQFRTLADMQLPKDKKHWWDRFRE